jgi:hypothetical protein
MYMVKTFASLISRHADVCAIKHSEEVLLKIKKKSVTLLVKLKTIVVWIMIMNIMIPLVSKAMGVPVKTVINFPAVAGCCHHYNKLRLWAAAANKVYTITVFTEFGFR